MVCAQPQAPKKPSVREEERAKNIDEYHKKAWPAKMPYT